jgi:hypothetical protein
MPVVTRSQSKKLQLKDISENVQDSLIKKSLLLSLHEMPLTLLADTEHYKKMYGKKEQNCSFDKLIKDMILFLICIILYLTINLLFYGAKKN